MSFLHDAEIEAIKRGAQGSEDAKRVAETLDVLERSRIEVERLKGEARPALSPTAADVVCAKIDQASGILLLDMLPGAHFKGVTAYGSEAVPKGQMVRDGSDRHG